MEKLSFEDFYQDHLEVLNAYRQALSTLYVDQNTVAPKNGARDTNQVMAILSREQFAKEMDPDMIARIEEYEKGLPEGSLEKKEVTRRLQSLHDFQNVPADVYADFIRIRGNSETTWHEAKEKQDYSLFKDDLKKLTDAQLNLITYSDRYEEGKAYDYLLDQYEKGMNQEKYDAFFDVIKEELPPLIEKIRQAKPIDTSALEEEADIRLQDELSHDVLDLLACDPGYVYLSTTEHPFTDFLSGNDVRITTHYYPNMLASAILSTVHEYGHGLFALQTDKAFDKTTLNDPDMAAHESQSRFLENYVGRSPAFWSRLYPKLQEKFPRFKDIPLDNFMDMLNASVPGLVRTEADELTYPLHILIRYELEKEMAKGTLDFDKLPELWADKYEQYLGVRPANDAEGVLQDMHWSAGNFGYFPTYALGSAYAAQLYEAMKQDFDPEEALAAGDFIKIRDWLKDNVQHYGASKSMAEIVEEVSGKPFDPHIYTDYLKNKYTKLYHLD